MAGQRLDFPIFAPDHASANFTKVGRAASAASDDVLGLAKRLDEVGKKSETARVGLAGDKEANAQLDKLNLKMLAVGRKVTGDISIDGAAKASAEITGLEAKFDGLIAKSAEATAATGPGVGGLSGVSGMGALIGAGVALSPVIATVGIGTAAFAAAAAGAVAPIAKAAQATGGLQKNMHTLDPEQQQLARGLLDLGKQYHAFEQSLQPEVLAVFGSGLRIAGHLMHDLQPVAASTGKAIGSLLNQVDAEFQSGTWQDFFGFMARTAGPDIQLLGTAFTTLMDTLPGLLIALQPVAVGLLNISIDALKVVDAISKLPQGLDNADKSAKATGGAMGALEHGLVGVGKVLIEPGFGLRMLKGLLDGSGGAADKTSKAVGGLGDSAAATRPPVFNLAAAVKELTADMQKNIGTVLTLQGDDVSWRQALQAATKQLDSNSAGLTGNSKNALANKQAVLSATNQVVKFADDQITLGGNLQAASRRIQDQIGWLQRHGDKSIFARREIRALRDEEDKLRATIRQRLIVTGSGSWHIGQTTTPGGPKTQRRAAGGRLAGFGGGDIIPVLAEPGEAIIDKHRTAKYAPVLRAMGVPGMAQGGLLGGQSVPALTNFLGDQDRATVHDIDLAVVAAIRAAQRAAAQGGGGFGVPGPGGGAPGANAALARRMFPSVDFPSWNYVAMRESGWNQFARNPKSGAYGIPQALPPSKMGPAANPPQSNVMAQLSWMVGYMNSRYGGAGGAAAHERAFNWYDQGGMLPRGLSLAYNGTGRPERVLGPGEGTAVVIQLAGSGHGTLDRALLQWIQQSVRVQGGGDVQVAFGAG